MPPEREEDVVEADPFDPAEATYFLPFPNVFDIRIGVSYLTSEKLFEALVVIFFNINKIITLLII